MTAPQIDALGYQLGAGRKPEKLAALVREIEITREL